MTLRTKASIILCLLISLALGITGYFYLTFFETSLRDSIFKGLASVGETSSQAITRFLSDSLREAEAVARAIPKSVLENRDTRAMESILSDYLRIFPKFENGMFLLDPEGRLWADYPIHPETRGRRFDYRQYFQRTRAEKKGIVGTPYRSKRTGKPVLTFTAILQDEKGNFMGLLGCSVELTSQKALEGIRLTKIGASGYLYVYDKDRMMILHPREERIFKKDVPVGVNELFDAAIEGFEGTGETVNSKGIPMLIYLKHIKGTNWIMGCQQTKKEAYAPIIRARKRIVAAVLLAAVSAGLLGAVLMRGITIPLMKLQEASRFLGHSAGETADMFFQKSKISQKLVGIPDSGELGELKHAFLTMHEKLEQTMNSLSKLATDWENTFDSVDDVIFLLDKKDRILRLNRSARLLFQKENHEVIEKPIEEYLGPFPDGVLSKTDMPASDRQSNNFNLMVETTIGEKKTFEMNCAPLIDENNAPVGKVVSGKDITLRLATESEKRQLEVKLVKAQKMEAIGTLAGGVAHDLNNILSGVVSYPELLLMKIPSDSELRKPLETIMQSGKKAAAIVQDMLTLARRGVASIDVLNLNTIITEYFKSPEFEKLLLFHRGIQIVMDLDPDLLNVEGSQVHLSKMVMNLVSNAAEAMPEGGKITISTTNTHMDEDAIMHDTLKEGDYVVITILDEGSGIGADEKERIFEPFYTKKTMGRSGTGLGMSVVWGTVTDHNGHIDVQSEVGQWTKFTIFFPATRKKTKETNEDFDFESIKGGGEHILVVDDVEEQRTIAVSILTQLGYSADCVASGLEAIGYLKKRKVDLLILDMIMAPGMDGYETYKRAIEANPGLKAIIASGFSETEAVKKTQVLGAGTYVRKPYTIRNIGLAIKRELAKG